MPCSQFIRTSRTSRIEPPGTRMLGLKHGAEAHSCPARRASGSAGVLVSTAIRFAASPCGKPRIFGGRTSLSPLLFAPQLAWHSRDKHEHVPVWSRFAKSVVFTMITSAGPPYTIHHTPAPGRVTEMIRRSRQCRPTLRFRPLQAFWRRPKEQTKVDQLQ